jgi:predicted esterase
VHFCFGNYGGQTIQKGNWQKLLSFLNALHTDHLVLELAHRPKADLDALKQIDKKITLGVGVIDIKVNHIETADEVAARIEAVEKKVGPGRVRWVHPRLRFLDAQTLHRRPENRSPRPRPRPLPRPLRFAAELGMVGIAPDYRTKGRHDVSPLGSVADSRAALRWVQDHAGELGLDPARIAVGGNSAGGHVALWTALAATPPGSDPAEAPRLKPAALILFSTVSDTSPKLGYTPKRFGADATALSPLDQLDANMPPVLAFHGDADKTVPLAQAIALRDKLMEGGNACELHIVPGGGHNFGNDVPEWREKSRELMIAFLKQQKLLP